MIGVLVVTIAFALSIISIVIDVLISGRISEYVSLAGVILGYIGALLFLGEVIIRIMSEVL